MNTEGLAYIEKLLIKYPYSETEVLLKLKRRGVEGPEAQEIINFLKRDGYINDERLAREVLRKYSVTRGRGNRWIQAKMNAKGISKETISEALKSRPEAEEEKVALREAQKIAKGLPLNLDRNRRRTKLIQRLSSRGFNGNIIFKVIDQIG